jgi:small subunit ribosomal protein S6
MQNYLLTLLVNENTGEKERKELLETLTKKMGKVEKEDLWGMRSLTYPIKHQNKAFYAHFEFSSEPGSISDIDKTLKVNEDIIRYLILKKD